MNETYMYRGHAIDLDLNVARNERIRWTYFIDKRYCMQGATDSQTIDTARVSALALAYGAIDKLDAMGSGQSSTPAPLAAICRLMPKRMNPGV